MKQQRVLVVDDSVVFRSLMAESVHATGAARVVAHAGNGREALSRLEEFSPDVVTLDLEMPVMGGLEALQAIKQARPDTVVIVVSGACSAGASLALRALELGALDFIAKPTQGDPRTNKAALTARLRELLEATSAPKALGPKRTPDTRPGLRLMAPVHIVGIGSSTGGPAALSVILPRLPASLPVPVVLAQHMPPTFTASLAEQLARKCAVRVVEARHGERPVAGTVYIAPGGRHLRVASAGGAERHLELTDDPPEHFCRPAVDYLFRSLSEVYREHALGVILTGMGKDGTLGLKAMKKHAVLVIGQSEESCTVYGMPREAMAAGFVDVELPAERIADAIVQAATHHARS